MALEKKLDDLLKYGDDTLASIEEGEDLEIASTALNSGKPYLLLTRYGRDEDDLSFNVLMKDVSPKDIMVASLMLRRAALIALLNKPSDG